jgi:hypothetical protein
MTLLIPAFALLARSTSPYGLASQPGRTLPYHRLARGLAVHSFGGRLEPRYVVGARPLDQ